MQASKAPLSPSPRPCAKPRPSMPAPTLGHAGDSALQACLRWRGKWATLPKKVIKAQHRLPRYRPDGLDSSPLPPRLCDRCAAGQQCLCCRSAGAVWVKAEWSYAGKWFYVLEGRRGAFCPSRKTSFTCGGSFCPAGDNRLWNPSQRLANRARRHGRRRKESRQQRRLG